MCGKQMMPLGAQKELFVPKNSDSKNISQKTCLHRFGWTLQPLPGQQIITSSSSPPPKENYTLLKTNIIWQWRIRTFNSKYIFKSWVVHCHLSFQVGYITDLWRRSNRRWKHHTCQVRLSRFAWSSKERCFRLFHLWKQRNTKDPLFSGMLILYVPFLRPVWSCSKPHKPSPYVQRTAEMRQGLWFEWTILGSTTLKESWLPHSKFPANPLQDLRQTHYSGMRGGFQVSLPVLNRNTQSKQSIEVADISFFRDILCIKWNLQNGNVAHPSLYVYNCCCKKQDGSHEPGCSLVILK